MDTKQMKGINYTSVPKKVLKKPSQQTFFFFFAMLSLCEICVTFSFII